MATAVILELDTLDDSLASRAPAPGLLPIGGRPMVGYVAEALAQCGDIDEVILAGPSVYENNPAALRAVDRTVLSDAPLGERVLSLLQLLGDRPEVILCQPNLPLLTAEMVETFLAHAPTDAAITWTVVREERLTERFPDAAPFSVQAFGSERVAWTPLASLKPSVLADRQDILARILDSRLNSAEAVKVLGMGLAIKWKAGRATLGEVARWVSELLGATCVVQISPHAELALRVRGRDDHHVAREKLESR